MTSIMSVRAGKSGRVWSFEPHPLTFEELVKNVQRWKGHGELAEVFAHQIALSDRNGEGLLNIPGDDSINRAVASVHNGTHSAGANFTVALGRLEELVTERDEVGVLKIDVEGHEYQALRGAESLLQRHRIRDILFEDYQPYPSLTTAMLERYGYTVFTVRPRLLGLSLGHGFRHPVVSHGYIPTYLATIDPDRVIRRLNPRGWIALRRYSKRCQE
jgi:FkbM family methyltransferase